LAYPLEIACYGRDMSAVWNDVELEVCIPLA
jgi:hypothetical protein